MGEAVFVMVGVVDFTSGEFERWGRTVKVFDNQKSAEKAAADHHDSAWVYECDIEQGGDGE